MNEWLLRRSRRPHAVCRLYCFPYAGGSPGEFLRWEAQLPDIEVWGILPPGRGRRLDEPPFTDAIDLVRELVRAVDFGSGFILFGHSLGALLAYETARALRDAGRPAPEALVVTAHRPPDAPHGDPPIHNLSDAAFREEVARRYPAPPPELAEDPELLDQSYRMLRSDLAVFETYRHVPGPPLTCPITVASGRDDHWSSEDLAGWSRHTTAGCEIKLVAGDHFFLPDQPDEILPLLQSYAYACAHRGGR